MLAETGIVLMTQLCGLQVIEGVTRALGETVWNNTFIGLTHGRLTSLPDDLTYGKRLLAFLAPPISLPVHQHSTTIARGAVIRGG